LDIVPLTVVGEFHARRRANFVEPHDHRIREWIEIPPGWERPRRASSKDRIGAKSTHAAKAEELDGLIVHVEVVEQPGRGRMGVGRVLEVLGRREDFGVDVEMVIRKHGLPHAFPESVLLDAYNMALHASPATAEGRRDFRSLDVVTIDGETARDFDDAVWVDRLSDGTFALHVHVADVAHYVRPGSPIDVEARLRGTSVYFPDRAVPMLPLELSTDLCSLKPNEDRPVLSVLLVIDRHGDVVHQEFTRGLMRSVERMTYTAVQAVLDGDAETTARYERLAPRFRLMEELARILNKRRERRGSIDFDLPEPIIDFDEAGEMTSIRRAPRHMSHRIIEEFMLAANEAVASHLEHLDLPLLYRIHEPPDADRVMQFEDIAARFGYSLGFAAIPVKRFPMVDRKRDGRKIRKDLVLADERLAVTSRHYQRLAAKLEGKPEERILNYLMLRSLKQARYAAENTGHFALAAKTYTHFTSPIRRYPDLIVHRILSSTFDGARGTRYEMEELRSIAAETSLAERRAADAERELVSWKKAKFMAERVGDHFHSLIVHTAKFGFFVELEEYFVEGLVPIETLPGGRYNFHENTRKIVNPRTRREYSIGDRLEVRLDRVEAVEGKLQFSVVEPERATGRRRSK
jgi:ribonuclease R